MADQNCDVLIEKLHLETLYEKRDNGEIKKYFDAIFRDAIGETRCGEDKVSSKRAAAAISAVSSFLKRTPRVNLEMAVSAKDSVIESTAIALAGEDLTDEEEEEFYDQIDERLPAFVAEIISNIKAKRNVVRK
jgi:hypothetical protein